jgi:hypothetical protein
MKRLIVILFVVATLVLGPVTAVSAGEPAQRIPFGDVDVDVVNPCTNEDVTVTWTDLMLVIRNGQDANGGIHIVFTLEGSIVDTSGNTGQFLWTSHANGADPDTYKETEHFTVIGRNSDTKQTIVLHSTARFNYEDGNETIDFFIFDEECRGKPN